MSIRVDEDRCPQDHSCPALAVCPVGALQQIGLSAPAVDEDICTDCGACIRRCPMGALLP